MPSRCHICLKKVEFTIFRAYICLGFMHKTFSDVCAAQFRIFEKTARGVVKFPKPGGHPDFRVFCLYSVCRATSRRLFLISST